MDIFYREGKKEDCAVLAELINIASAGAIDYLFHDLIPGMTPVQLVAHNLESAESYYSYENAIVAEYRKEPVGVSLSFPSYHHQITEELEKFLPNERLEHFRHFFTARVENSLFLDALCVDARLRGSGIGSKLITLTKSKAKDNGFDALSLMVFADNKEAQRLYVRCGFKVEEEVELNSDERIPHEGGCLLMKCDL